MIRRMLNAMVTLGVIGVMVVFAARVAEPSVRPILYPVSASPVTLVASVAVEVASPVEASQTSSVDTASTTTSVAPVATTLAATTTVPTTTTTTTTTVAPVDEVAVLTASYAWGRSTDAAVLQQVLGVEADGWYGPATRAAHVAENQARGLPVDA
ncbi:MAG: peptidoglycan-binding domain-containing protein, partial [Acidimicrobiales bacterium]